MGYYIENSHQLFSISIEDNREENGLTQTNDKFRLLRETVESFPVLFITRQILNVSRVVKVQEGELQSNSQDPF